MKSHSQVYAGTCTSLREGFRDRVKLTRSSDDQHREQPSHVGILVNDQDQQLVEVHRLPALRGVVLPR